MILMFTAAVGALEIDVCDVQMSSTDSIPFEGTVTIRKSAMIMRISHNNKTNHSISSNSYPSATANIAIHCLKRGGGDQTNQMQSYYRSPTWYEQHLTYYADIYFVWLRITDVASVPEMHIWSILLIKSDKKWCIHLSRSLFLYITQNLSFYGLEKLNFVRLEKHFREKGRDLTLSQE